MGYTSSSAEGFLVALHAAEHTKRLSYLVAHRPGFVAPTLMARKIATFDHLTGGRLAVHIITGKTDEEQQGDGDFSSKIERYRRAAEYLELMKLAWSSERPFDFSGEFYRVKGRRLGCTPAAETAPATFLRRCLGWRTRDGCQTLRRLRHLRGAACVDARTHRRTCGFRRRRSGVLWASTFRVRPIIAAREGDAWDKANRILAAMTGKKGWSRQEEVTGPVDNAGRRLMHFALDRDVHDERLWMPIARATGALGNTSCLVGTPEQVAEAILKYYTLGVDLFLIRGFDPFNDTLEFGRELIPRIKEGAIDIDRRRAAE